MFRDYDDVRKWLDRFIPHVWTRKELGLERIGYLLKLLGNPQNKFKSIHIAGTSGKGSTAFYIAKLLERSLKLETRNSKLETNSNDKNSKAQNKISDFGFRHSNFPTKVGLHISPHLVDIRERMQINGKLIELTKFIKLIEEIKKPVELMKDSRVGYPSYFEILVAASFLYFAKEKVNWAVVEVGLGGRLDATNVLNPALTVITNVGLDHTEILGTKVEKIAYEKAGIIKPKVPVVTGAVGKALKVIEKIAKEKKAPLIKVDTRSAENVLKSDAVRNSNLPIDIFRSTSYSFAFSNKLLALAAVKALGISPYNNKQYSSSEAKRNREVPRKISSRQARTVLGQAFDSTFPGRFEEIEPYVILDGAHNVDKIRYLIDQLRNSSLIPHPSSLTLVLAFKKDKNWQKMIDLLVKNLPVSKVIATKFYAVTDMGKYQAVEQKEIADYVSSIKYKVLSVEAIKNSHEAVFSALKTIDNYSSSEAQAKSRSSPKNKFSTSSNNSLVLVTGSLYLVGEARTVWKLPEF